MENLTSIKIIAESNDNSYIVVYKPRGLPSAPLTVGDKNNALMQAVEIYPEIKKVKGRKEIEYGLIHRLDTVTDGLMIIATTQEACDQLLKLQEDGKIKKTYSAECELDEENKIVLEGFPVFKSQQAIEKGNTISVESYFRSFGAGGKSVRPVTEDSGKAALKKLGKIKKYSTDIRIIEKTGESVKVECEITNGYRHQVRCHLAWAGLPIIGDTLYNKKYVEKDENNIKFTAIKIDICGDIWYI